MSELEETYCRLCAEPTPLEQLILTEDDVGINSKIAMKLLWINIDVSNANQLPKTICFSCFDLLERYWGFLHNVREAQHKLNNLYSTKLNAPINTNISEENVGKPIEDDWETFQDAKVEVKVESNLNDVNINNKNEETVNGIKSEPQDSDVDIINNSCGYSSDSDLPLKVTKKKKLKKKKKQYDEEILEADLLNPSHNVLPLVDVPMYNMSWDDYTWCCSKCDAQCKTIDSLRIHSFEIHNRCSSFKCSQCNKPFSTYKLFISHIRSHYKTLKYYCDVCNKYFYKSSMVSKHYNPIHRGGTTEQCKTCGTIFENTESYLKHIELYRKTNRKITNESKIEDIEEGDLKCDICQREFKSRSNLFAHKLVHTERRRNFSCHVCGKMFYTKGALSTHMLTHEDTKLYKCEFCPLAFRARGNLTSHISIHSGAKPFVCEQCGKSFRVKRHLKSHSIVHTDLMPYACEYCDKTFRFKTRLNLHIRQHTGAKPYTCTYCRRDFTNGSNYKKHMKRRHNIDTSTRKKFSSVVNHNQESNDVKESLTDKPETSK